jgi:hypothetical protein
MNNELERKNMKNVNHDSLCSGRDLKPGPNEYDFGLVTTRTRRLVK